MKLLIGLGVLGLTVLLGGLFSAAAAAVLCANPSGGVSLRTQCNSNETQLDPVALGLVGPRGPQGPQGPPGPSGTSHAYHATNFRDKPSDDALVGLIGLPAGSYVVGVTVITVGDDESIGMTCLIRINDDVSHPILPVGGTAIYSAKDDGFGGTSMMLTLTLPSAGSSIKVFCGSGDKDASAQGEIVAVQVDALN
jgi:hypothetical protein